MVVKKKDKDLIDFITRILKSVKHNVDESLQIYGPDEKTPLIVNGYPSLVPSRETAKRMNVIVNGVSKRKFELFNPLTEDVIRGGSPSLSKLTELMEGNLHVQLVAVIRGLLSITSIKKRDEIPLEFQTYVTRLEKKRGRGGKTLVSKGFIKEWEKLTELFGKGLPKLVSVYTKRGLVYDDVTYPSGTIITSPILDQIKDNRNFINENSKLKISKMDLTALYNTIEFVLEGYIDTPLAVSDSKLYPGFIALSEAYLSLSEYLNGLLKKLEIHEPDIKYFATELFYSLDDIEEVELLEAPLKVATYNTKPKSNAKSTPQRPNTRPSPRTPAVENTSIPVPPISRDDEERLDNVTSNMNPNADFLGVSKTKPTTSGRPPAPVNRNRPQTRGMPQGRRSSPQRPSNPRPPARPTHPGRAQSNRPAPPVRNGYGNTGPRTWV